MTATYVDTWLSKEGKDGTRVRHSSGYDDMAIWRHGDWSDPTRLAFDGMETSTLAVTARRHTTGPDNHVPEAN